MTLRSEVKFSCYTARSGVDEYFRCPAAGCPLHARLTTSVALTKKQQLPVLVRYTYSFEYTYPDTERDPAPRPWYRTLWG
eukprot:scaffold320126_cov43-Prasinocladus_malaysianus.AAC.1